MAFLPLQELDLLSISQRTTLESQNLRSHCQLLTRRLRWDGSPMEFVSEMILDWNLASIAENYNLQHLILRSMKES